MDHLGSTSVTYRASDGLTATHKYKPWGETRQVSGEMPTDYTFTGQREHTSIEMLWYNSRFYDPNLGRFSQADSLVPYPGFPLSFDRYNYVRNNPVNRIDPTGHMDICPDCGGGSSLSAEEQLEQLRILREEDHNQSTDDIAQFEENWPVISGSSELWGYFSLGLDVIALSFDMYAA